MDNACMTHDLRRTILVSDQHNLQNEPLLSESDCPLTGQYRPADPASPSGGYAAIFGCTDGSETQLVSSCRSQSALESHCSNTQTTQISKF